MLPMGSIMAGCMLIAVVSATPFIHRRLTKILQYGLGSLTLAAGLWNTLWYGTQHITEFWGLAALGSGLLMIITSILIVEPEFLPGSLGGFKTIVLASLLGFFLLYAITIYRL